MDKKTLVVVGGGAAGFFCAITAASLYPQLQAIIVEKSNKLLAKVKVSGGGRCNVTNACFSIAAMIKNYPRGAAFLKKAFHHFFTTDTIKWFEERGVKLKTEADGRVFPVTNSSQTIVDCLIKEANKYNVQILLNAEVKGIEYNNKKFHLQFTNSRIQISDYLCIATGGYPKSEQFNWLKQLGHSIEEPVPSLFTFNLPNSDITKLMGVSVENASVKIVGSKLFSTGPLLITHWGFSGPAVLKLSALAARDLQKTNYRFEVAVNWLPAFNENTFKEKMQELRFQLAAQKIINRNPFALPQRLWDYLLLSSGIEAEKRWADLTTAQENRLIKNCCTFVCTVSGKTTFKEEFVTCGGIKLSEIDASTLQSNIVPGLFFAGEVLDIDGVTGGFNFQNAWTTGFIAGKSISNFQYATFTKKAN
jgi:predicted Rossmann fold flavoprotein